MNIQCIHMMKIKYIIVFVSTYQRFLNKNPISYYFHDINTYWYYKYSLTVKIKMLRISQWNVALNITNQQSDSNFPINHVI